MRIIQTIGAGMLFLISAPAIVMTVLASKLSLLRDFEDDYYRSIRPADAMISILINAILLWTALLGLGISIFTNPIFSILVIAIYILIYCIANFGVRIYLDDLVKRNENSK